MIARFVTAGLVTVAAAMFAGHWFLGLRLGTGARCADAAGFAACDRRAELGEAWAVLAGPAALLAVAALIYLGRPLLGRLHRVGPLEAGSPLWHEIQARAAAAGLRRTPRIDRGTRLEPYVYGAWPPYRLMVPPQMIGNAVRGSATDAALLAHELGHARTGDATRYGAVIACWYASLAVVVVPVAADAWLLPGRIAAAPLTWRLLVVTAMVFLAVLAANRAREFEADARAFRDDPAARVPVGGDPALVAAIRGGEHGWLRFAPSPARRLAALADPGLVARPVLTGAAVAGAGAGLLGTELSLLVELAFPGHAWPAYLIAALLTAVPAVTALGVPRGLPWPRTVLLGLVFGFGLLAGTQLAPRASADWWQAFPEAGGRAAQLSLLAAAPATAVVIVAAALLAGVAVTGWLAGTGPRWIGVPLLGVLLAVWLLAVRLGAGSGWSPRLLAATLLTPSRQVPLLAVAVTALVLSRTGRQRILFLIVLLVAAAPWTWLGRRDLHDGRWTAIPPPATTNAVYACFWTNKLGPAGLPGPGDTAGLAEVGAYLSGVDDAVLREAGRTMTTDPQGALRLLLARCDSLLSAVDRPLPKAS